MISFPDVLRVIIISVGIGGGDCSFPYWYLLLDMWSPVAYLWASLKTLVCSGSDKVWLNKTMMSFHVKSKAKVICWKISMNLPDIHLYSFPGLVWSILVLRGRRVYGPGLVRILLQFQLRDILELAFVEEVLPDMGARSDTRKKHQATWELWEVSLHGGRCSFSWLSVPDTICLVGSLLGHTTIPYLRQSSFISLSLKKMWI